MRIDLAYCEELDKVVDIEEAREAFFEQEEYDKFHFLCSDKDCKEVRVTGVNHNKSPESDRIFKTPHFRELDKHADTCVWLEYTKAVEELKGERNKKRVGACNRNQHQLSSPIVEKFYLPSIDVERISDKTQSNDLTDIVNNKRGSERQIALRNYIRERGTTSRSLETLVSCYEELKELGALDEQIDVAGKQRTTFRRLFTSVVHLGSDDRFHVYYGGAKFGKKYGNGFSLIFFDKFEELPLSLYVSNEDVTSSKRYRLVTSVIDRLIAAKSENPKSYVNVYWIGGVEKRDNKASIQFLSPKHLAIRFVPR
ncbi:hypothetical protein HFQ13_09420 [Acidithiobacillus sp. VAN18-1]|uniref:Uncharacterized protein n=1 Tax=Igneacidithiobacillus copahuensis TaxID=2724909 RepID=A0AAE2YRA1_9PROT|nr:hypothetical protein [Igneacidithiobacillus copahuensis]MBU2788415.1 hypothetical protein [Igneacidithiobacillus copahuensis]MBU2796916.1 hypothetical protein [Acidithiobacillus sp. VAN18-2]